MTSLKLFHSKLKVIKARYNHNMEPLIKLSKHFLELDAIIPRGEYKDRCGKITGVSIKGSGELYGVIIPYRLLGNKNKFIVDSRPDARTFWKLSEVKAIRIRK